MAILKKLNEKEIQKIIFNKYGMFKYQFMNAYFFETGNESDWLGIDYFNYITEIEIKSSRGDFKNDFNKIRSKVYKSKYYKNKTFINPTGLQCIMFPNWEICKTHSQFIYSGSGAKPFFYIENSSKFEICKIKIEMIPNRFYYCVQNNVLKKEEIPEYAGLMYVDTNGKLEIIKEAPLLHEEILETTKLFDNNYNLYYSRKKTKEYETI